MYVSSAGRQTNCRLDAHVVCLPNEPAYLALQLERPTMVEAFGCASTKNLDFIAVAGPRPC